MAGGCVAIVIRTISVSPISSQSPNGILFRVALTIAVLALIGWSAWRSIPVRQIHFSPDQFAINRKLAGEAKFLSPPAAISPGYSIGKQGVRLSRGESISYDVSRSERYFRGVFQAADKTGGKTQVSVVRHGQSTILFERSLAPSRQDIDAAPYGFIINLATLAPDTERLLLTTDNGVIDWRECGFVDEQMFAGFSNVPLQFLVADGYSAPAWTNKILLLQSPVRLDFIVPSGHHRLLFQYGFNPSLFNEAHAFSDGIGFKAELITTTGTTHELLNRLLEPYSHSADRELQTASLDLNLSEPGKLRLSATPGPVNNVAWDWSVCKDFQLETISP